MNKVRKIIIVGGSAAGSTLATNLRRLDDFVEIIIIEKGPDVSYANCSLPYYFSKEVESIEELIVTSPEDFKKKYNIEARVNQEAIKINREEKTLDIKNLEDKSIYSENYDLLVLATGGRPNSPEDLLGEKTFNFKNLEDVRKIDKFIKENKVENISVVGNGYIGVEVAEAFSHGGYKVKLIGSRDQVLIPFDKDMAQFIHKEMDENGIDLILSARVKEATEKGILLEDGREIEADLIILAIGQTPETSLITEAGLEIGETKGILVDHNFKTKDDFIFAIGDAIEVYHIVSKKKTMLALAGPAHKQADKLANYLCGKEKDYRGVIGANSLRVFDLNLGSVGLNEKNLQEDKLDYDYVFSTYRDRVEGGQPLYGKILFEKKSGRILGGQFIGSGEISKRLDTLSSLIFFEKDIYDMWENELAYSPFYSTPKDTTNILAYNAIKVLEGEYEKVGLKDIRKIVEEEAYILDTSSERKYKKAHLKGAINIPTSQLRERLEELPKDEKIYINSYSALRILAQRGFNNLVLIEGDIEDIKSYEYFLDKIENRESIIAE